MCNPLNFFNLKTYHSLKGMMGSSPLYLFKENVVDRRLGNRTRSVECLPFKEYGSGSSPDVFINFKIWNKRVYNNNEFLYLCFIGVRETKKIASCISSIPILGSGQFSGFPFTNTFNPDYLHNSPLYFNNEMDGVEV